MQPSPRMTTKDCECGARMTWTRRGFIFPRWRLECLCGRAGPWRKLPEYQKLGPPPFGGSGAVMLRDLIGWGEATGPSKEADQ